MNNFKFRQPIDFGGGFQGWHYWGWLGKNFFQGPLGKNMSPHQGFQFTGLTDSSGVEIYEGDIIVASPRAGGEFNSYKVHYDQVYCSFVGHAKKLSGWEENYAIGELRFDPEVIGNIFENPELA